MSKQFLRPRAIPPADLLRGFAALLGPPTRVSNQTAPPGDAHTFVPLPTSYQDKYQGVRHSVGNCESIREVIGEAQDGSRPRLKSGVLRLLLKSSWKDSRARKSSEMFRAQDHNIKWWGWWGMVIFHIFLSPSTSQPEVFANSWKKPQTPRRIVWWASIIDSFTNFTTRICWMMLNDVGCLIDGLTVDNYCPSALWSNCCHMLSRC